MLKRTPEAWSFPRAQTQGGFPTVSNFPFKLFPVSPCISMRMGASWEWRVQRHLYSKALPLLPQSHCCPAGGPAGIQRPLQQTDERREVPTNVVEGGGEGMGDGRGRRGWRSPWALGPQPSALSPRLPSLTRPLPGSSLVDQGPHKSSLNCSYLPNSTLPE